MPAFNRPIRNSKSIQTVKPNSTLKVRPNRIVIRSKGQHTKK